VSPPPTSREQRFRALYDELRPPLLRFARRRTGPEAVEDVVAEALLVLWRRLDEVPAGPDEARAWAYGVTRHVLLNQHRGRDRRQALGLRLLAHDDTRLGAPVGHDVDVLLTRLDIARAWQRLSEVHQEALGLAVLEGLDTAAASAVIGISPVAYRLRLSRARRALRAHLGQPAPATTTPRLLPTTARSTP